MGESRTYIGPNADLSAIRTNVTGSQTIIIQLSERSALEVASQSGANQSPSPAAIRSQVARVEAAQQTVLSEMNTRGIPYTVIGSTEQVLSSLIVRADASTLATLNQLPGVDRAFIERIGYFDNSTSVPFVGAVTFWSNGMTGSGIRVGLIDSGLDYDHVNFGGPGDGTCNFATEFGTAKIPDGYDFVGNSWSPGSGFSPDPDPCDQNGHGSHVGGTIGGFGVDGGTTYAGPYPPANFLAMDIGPGVAPGAAIYPLKVGSASDSVSEAATILALEWAADPDSNPGTDDAMHVVNMSIGGNYGDPLIGWAAASNTLAMSGTVVVSSAGNAGDSYFIQGDPSTGDYVIAVAASADGNLGIEVTASANAGLVGNVYEAIPAGFGGTIPPAPGIDQPLVLVNDASGLTTACDNWDGTTYTPPGPGFVPFTNAAAVAGNIALIDRGACPFSVKFANAQANGAVAIIVANNAPGAPPLMGDTPLGYAITIPGEAISQADGATLRAGGNIPLSIRMAADITYGPSTDTLADFSSRGPQRHPNAADVGVKPDIAAPGASITSTAMGTGNGATTFGGTSMASPHVAGAMALLVEQHPTWNVVQLKALVMNTAQHNVHDASDDFGPARVGVGRLDLNVAYQSDWIAYQTADPERVSLSYGIQNLLAGGIDDRTVTVQNNNPTGAAVDVISVTYEPLVDMPGVTVSIVGGLPAAIPGAGGTGSFTVRLDTSGIHNNASHVHDPTLSETQNGYPRHWLGEESGLLHIELSSGMELWLPVFAAPRPAGDMVHDPLVDPIPVNTMTGSTIINMVGTDVNTGGSNYPEDVIGLVTAFELMYEGTPAGLGGFYDSADIEYVGVTTDYNDAGGAIANTHVYFGISTFGDWASLSEETWFQIYIDADQDGTPENFIWNWNEYNFSGNESGDVFIPIVEDVNTATQTWYDGDPLVRYVNMLPGANGDADWGTGWNSAAFQNSVMYMGVPASAIGLADGASSFDFWVEGYYFDDTLVSQTPVMTYDPSAHGIDFNDGFTGAPMYFDTTGNGVPLAWDFTVYQGANPPCVLLLHHHNVSGARGDTVCLQPNLTYDVGVLKAVSDPAPEEGTNVTYTITVTNNDQVSPVNVNVTDVLPAGVTYVSSTATQGTYSELTGIWTVGVLPAGGSATLDIVASVDNGTAGSTITNTVTAEGTVGTDTNPVDNTASVDIVPVEGTTPPTGDDDDDDGGTPGTGGDGGTVGTGSTGTGTGEAPTTLPSTGYPPSDEDAQSSTMPLYVVVAGSLALVAAGGVLLLRRRMRA